MLAVKCREYKNLYLDTDGMKFYIPTMNSTYEICRVKRVHYGYDWGEKTAQDPLVIGIDLSEEDAIDLNVPIRPGPNGEKYVWPDDIDPH